ncbi:hypothetical protein AAZX31_09G162100 [Glycine max]|nr:hypothetical protein GLYMA_09G179050v4 [Glycine max]KAH1043546.1 hypothetical protein GYH30_025405 [Glycine max]
MTVKIEGHNYQHHVLFRPSPISVAHYKVTFAFFKRPICLIRCVTKQSFSSLSYIVGCEFALGGFPVNVPAHNVFPVSVSDNADKAFQRELEKEQTRREIGGGSPEGNGTGGSIWYACQCKDKTESQFRNEF